jgi:hypothetical protein
MSPIELGATKSVVTVPMRAPTGPALLRADGKPRAVFLHLEHITSLQEAPSYDVYLNLPPDAAPGRHPELLVGNLAMFGLIESSRPRGPMPANGLTFKFDVTRIYAVLVAKRDWDPNNLRVTIVPEPWPIQAKVQVGRISVFFE